MLTVVFFFERLANARLLTQVPCFSAFNSCPSLLTVEMVPELIFESCCPLPVSMLEKLSYAVHMQLRVGVWCSSRLAGDGNQDL